MHPSLVRVFPSSATLHTIWINLSGSTLERTVQSTEFASSWTAFFFPLADAELDIDDATVQKRGVGGLRDYRMSETWNLRQPSLR